MKQKILSNFIVFEGIDGSGTTTQINLLKELLTQKKISHWATYEPTHGPVGRLIHSILEGHLNAAPETLALLFAADRNEHIYHGQESINYKISENKLVICDRYLFSSLAYQSIECDFKYIADLNGRFPLPYYVFFLDTPLEICAKRRDARSQSHIFETHTYQEKVIGQYEKAFAYFKHTDLHIIRLDGTKSKQLILEDVWKIISGLPIVKK
ncbi:MAG: dTMP kinase [Spirochaetales bacterium]|nr:dTMP kinase [Spirochaetales bacterium]